jgi:hypothetical protein
MVSEFSSLEFLQAVYRDDELPLHTRMRAAAMALPFEQPKLTAVAVINGDDFASRLEAAIRRSEAAQPQVDSKVIEVRPLPPAGPEPTPLGAPFPRITRRI